MKKRPIKRMSAITLLIALAVTLLGTTTALAYTLTMNGYYSKTIPIDRYTNCASTYITPASQAITSWNTAGVPGLGIYHSLSAKNKLYTLYMDDTWLGEYTGIEYGGSSPYHPVSMFRIIINKRLCDSLSSTEKRSVIAHELGHSIGVGHSFYFPYPLMSHSRNRALVYTPQSDDVQGAIASWERQ